MPRSSTSPPLQTSSEPKRHQRDTRFRSGTAAAQADPENPSQASPSVPSAALVAQAEAQSAFNSLFPGLGAVALLVGAVGVANIMIISVLERRSEIGLRRALGARRGYIRLQFLSEAMLLSLIGGGPFR
jgi:putative ABC transport system permease protein